MSHAHAAAKRAAVSACARVVAPLGALPTARPPASPPLGAVNRRKWLICPVGARCSAIQLRILVHDHLRRSPAAVTPDAKSASAGAASSVAANSPGAMIASPGVAHTLSPGAGP